MAKGAYWVFMSNDSGSGPVSSLISDVVDLTRPDLDLGSTRRTVVRTRLLVQGEQGIVGDNTELPGTYGFPGGPGGALAARAAAVWVYDDVASHVADGIPTDAFRPDYYPYLADHPFTDHGPVIWDSVTPGPLVYVPPGEADPVTRLPGWRRGWTLSTGVADSHGKRAAQPGFSLGSHVAIGPTGTTTDDVTCFWAWSCAWLVDWTDELL